MLEQHSSLDSDDDGLVQNECLSEYMSSSKNTSFHRLKRMKTDS